MRSVQTVPDKSPPVSRDATPAPSREITPCPPSRRNSLSRSRGPTPEPSRQRRGSRSRSRSVTRQGSARARSPRSKSRPKDTGDAGHNGQPLATLERQNTHARNTNVWLEPTERIEEPSMEISFDVDPSLRDATWAENSMAKDKKVRRGSRSKTGPHHIVRPSESRNSNAGSVAGSERSIGGMSTMSRASTLSLSEEQKVSLKNTCLMIFLAIAFVSDIVMGILYTIDPDSTDCPTDTYLVDLDVFLYLAGLTSGALFAVSAFAWWKVDRPTYRARRRKSRKKHRQRKRRKKPKEEKPPCRGFFHGALCIAFWNICWAIVGLYIWSTEMDADCRGEPVAIVMFIWCMFQFSWVCFLIAVIGMLVWILGGDLIKMAFDSLLSSITGD